MMQVLYMTKENVGKVQKLVVVVVNNNNVAIKSIFIYLNKTQNTNNTCIVN
jgi:hypothetical protein